MSDQTSTAHRYFQVRISSLLWAVLVLAAFIAGMEYQRWTFKVAQPVVNSPVATAGFFDLDNDGLNDAFKLHRMIANNGGTIVACETDRGQIVGQLSSDTKYLVVGDIPESAKKSHPLLLAADRLGIQQISTRELLADLMVTPAPRVVPKGIRMENAENTNF